MQAFSWFWLFFLASIIPLFDAFVRLFVKYCLFRRHYIVYDLQGNEIGRTAAPTGVDFDVIEYLLDDGRVVLSLGDDPAHNYVTRYATIDADAFLNGSTEYTEMEFVG